MDHLSFLESKAPAKKAVSVLPISMGIGSDVSGTADAPAYLLKLGFKEALAVAGFRAEVLPEVLVSNGVKGKEARLAAISKTVVAVREIVKGEISKGRKVLALGGDHALSIGTIAGAAEATADIGIIWIDAHADANTWKTSDSGNVHGMGASAVLGFGDERLTSVVKKKVKTKNFLYIGLKDLDQAEIDLIRSEKIAAVTMMDLLEHGFPMLAKEIQALQKKAKKVWVSMDMDSIDEQFAPGSAMATPGGLMYREITNLMALIGKTFEVVGMDLVEIVPKKDVAGKTARLAMELAASGFGSRYSWYSEYMEHYKKGE